MIGFIDGRSDISREKFGAKANSLNLLKSAGLNVPPAFVLSVESCRTFQQLGTLDFVHDPLELGLDQLFNECEIEGLFSKELIEVSVRSGAPVSMPGMMETILQVKIPRRREGCRREMRKQEITALLESIKAVYESWNSPRAIAYRKALGLPHDGGTGCIIQSMVFGDRDTNSGTGIILTHDPNTGDKSMVGEYLHESRGDRLVGGYATPVSLSSLREDVPSLYEELQIASSEVFSQFGAPQEIEFTVESGVLFFLQARKMNFTPVGEIQRQFRETQSGKISRDEFFRNLTCIGVRSLYGSKILGVEQDSVIASGLPASPGIGKGRIKNCAEMLSSDVSLGSSVVLALQNTTPEDFPAMSASTAIVTNNGGVTSHAAVVARSLGVPSVVGCGDVDFSVYDGMRVTVDGHQGRVILGDLQTASLCYLEPDIHDTICSWFMESLTEDFTLEITENKNLPESGVEVPSFDLSKPEHILDLKLKRPEKAHTLFLSDNKLVSLVDTWQALH